MQMYIPILSSAFPLTCPLFTFYRINNIQRSKLQEQLLDWSQVSLKSEIIPDILTALAKL